MNHIVEIQDKEFYWDGQPISNQTAVVSFISAAGVVLKKVAYGCCNRTEVISAIEKGLPVVLDGMYIKDFSLAEARKTEFHRIRLDEFSARHSFFDGNTDFSICSFSGSTACFREAVFNGTTADFRDVHFHCGVLDFAKTELTLRNIYFNHSHFDHCGLDFSGMTVRAGDFHFYAVRTQDSNLNFTGTHFSDGFKDFRKIQIKRGNLVFRSAFFNDGDTDFIEMKLDEGTVDFRLARFGSGELNFGGAHLGDGDKDFSGVVFPRGLVSFTGALFGKGSLHMIDAIFRKGNVHFNNCSFGCDDIHFTSTDFGDGYLDFSKSQFNANSFNVTACRFGKGDVEFNYSRFTNTEIKVLGTEFNQGKLCFFDTAAESVTFHECTFNNHVYLNFEHCDHLNILNCIIEKTLDLRSRYYTERQTVLVLNLSGTKNLGHIYLDWEMNRVKSMIYSQGSRTDVLDKASQFRLLKENFRNIGQYDDEDYAYVEFKRCQREGKYLQRVYRYSVPDVPWIVKQFAQLYAWLQEMFNWFMFDSIGRYGTSPRSVFTAMVNTIVVFSLIYMSPSVKLASTTMFSGSSNHFTNMVMHGIYQSIQTFLTIGYGQVNPGNFTAVLISGVEGFIGVFLMAYFTVSVVRKLLR